MEEGNEGEVIHSSAANMTGLIINQSYPFKEV